MRTIMMTNNIKITSIFRFFFWYCSAYRKREKSRHFPQNQTSLISSPILCIADLWAILTPVSQPSINSHKFSLEGPWPEATASQEALVSQEAPMRCGICHPDIGWRQKSAFSPDGPLPLASTSTALRTPLQEDPLAGAHLHDEITAG